MAIDLNTCVGCGACAMACKSENNTQVQEGGRKYNWADFLTFTEGSFPQVKYSVIPVLCNHCTDAPCVAICPATPKAMYKTVDGITMHNDSDCIGCQMCVNACPYSEQDVNTANKQYSVISYNPNSPVHSEWEDTSVILAGGTSSPDDVATAAGYIPPYKHDYTHADYNAVRPPDVTEKCIFCDHRVQLGDNPYCVDACPANARIFGDLDDANSEINDAIAVGYNRLEDNSGAYLAAGNPGSQPNVYYIGDYTVNSVEIPEKPKPIAALKVYPNPTSRVSYLEFELEDSSRVDISLYNIQGREVRRIVANEYKSFGMHKVEINVTGLGVGTYICSLRTQNSARSANIIVIK